MEPFLKEARMKMRRSGIATIVCLLLATGARRRGGECGRARAGQPGFGHEAGASMRKSTASVRCRTTVSASN